MPTIQTSKGAIAIHEPDAAMIKRLQSLLPYGLMPFKQPFNEASFGFVTCCGEREFSCLKIQPVEVEREQAERLFQIQYFMAMDAYGRYLKKGFTGAYLAAPYLRQRENGLWEAGLSHFIFPPEKDAKPSDKSFGKAYDNNLGEGATSMFTGYMESFNEAFAASQLTKPQYFSIDVRSRSHLQSIGMYFMALDNNMVCLRPQLRAEEDVAWSILRGAGIVEVFHLPSLPMTIREQDLPQAKGQI